MPFIYLSNFSAYGKCRRCKRLKSKYAYVEVLESRYIVHGSALTITCVREHPGLRDGRVYFTPQFP
jgi:hypothetical protein